MSATEWRFEHAVECGVPREFAWAYWTNIGNWDDPPAQFRLDGPFRAGARLTTVLPGEELHWVIREVQAGFGALIEMELMRAVVGLRWRFEGTGDRSTRISQTVSLSGDGAEALAGPARMFEANMPEGMRKLAQAMERSWEAGRQ
jgi:hypothetical protein